MPKGQGVVYINYVDDKISYGMKDIKVNVNGGKYDND